MYFRRNVAADPSPAPTPQPPVEIIVQNHQSEGATASVAAATASVPTACLLDTSNRSISPAICLADDDKSMKGNASFGKGGVNLKYVFFHTGLLEYILNIFLS